MNRSRHEIDESRTNHSIVSRAVNQVRQQAQAPVLPIAPPVLETCVATRYQNQMGKAQYSVGEEFNYTYRWSAGIIQLGSSMNGSSIAWFTPLSQWNHDKAGTSQLIYDSFFPTGAIEGTVDIKLYGRTNQGQVIACANNGLNFKITRAPQNQDRHISCKIRRNANGSSACIYFQYYAFYTTGVYDCSNGSVLVVHKYAKDDQGRMSCHQAYSTSALLPPQSVMTYKVGGVLSPN